MQTNQNPSARGLKSSPTRSLADCIHAEWENLSNEEVALAQKDRDRFIQIVQGKYSLNSQEVERQLRQWERECGQAA